MNKQDHITNKLQGTDSHSIKKLVDMLVLENINSAKAELTRLIEYRSLNEGDMESEFDVLWDKYVPSSGEAHTPFGKAVRAVGRFEHEFYNNGFENAYDDETGQLTPLYKGMLTNLDKYVKGLSWAIETLNGIKFNEDMYTGDHDLWDRQEPKVRKALTALKEYLIKNQPDKKEEDHESNITESLTEADASNTYSVYQNNISSMSDDINKLGWTKAEESIRQGLLHG